MSRFSVYYNEIRTIFKASSLGNTEDSSAQPSRGCRVKLISSPLSYKSFSELNFSAVRSWTARIVIFQSAIKAQTARPPDRRRPEGVRQEAEMLFRFLFSDKLHRSAFFSFLQIKTDVTVNEEVSYTPQPHSSKEKPAPAFTALARGRTVLIKSAWRGGGWGGAEMSMQNCCQSECPISLITRFPLMHCEKKLYGFNNGGAHKRARTHARTHARSRGRNGRKFTWTVPPPVFA